MARVGVVCDLLEENWPSMNTVADLLLHHLWEDHHQSYEAEGIRPPMRRRFSADGAAGGIRFNVDRVANRFWDYPRILGCRRGEFDVFHIVDHSYSHLVHEVPAERTIVTCHDLDTFRSILEPDREPRHWLFRAMTGRILEGLRKAAWVTCDSAATRDEVLVHQLVEPDRAVVIHNGVHPALSAKPSQVADAAAARLLGAAYDNRIELLNVASTIPRKRIDVLLHVFARVHRVIPEARLIRVGGAFTASQLEIVNDLRLKEHIVVLPYLDRETLAAVYRRATLVLLTSESEGFGLPVIEAMACGTPVLSSDLPVFREVGGLAACYAPVGNISAWSDAAVGLLHQRSEEPEQWAVRRAAGVAQSAKFSWEEYARKMVALYDETVRAG